MPVPITSSDAPEVLARFHAELDLVDLNARQVARRLLAAAPATLDDLRSFGREGLLQAARIVRRVAGRSLSPLGQHAHPRRDDRRRAAMGAPAASRVPGASRDGGGRRRAGGAERGEHAAIPATTPEAADRRLASYLAGIATAIAVGARWRATRASRDGRDPSPEELAAKAELVERVRAIVLRLPDAERTLIERHYFADETLDQAAASLGLSKSWGSRLHARAIERIARELARQSE